MPDRGRFLEFGFFADPRASRYAGTVAQVRLADELGLDLVGLHDHPYLAEHLDMWTLLVDLAARTSRVRLFPDVANLPLRPSAMLGKAVASLDVMTGGRVDLGLGAGASWEAIAAVGGPRRSPGEAVAALEDALQVLRATWSGRLGARSGGAVHEVAGLHAGPFPGRRIEVWLGALGPRMLDLTGRLADGWLPTSAYVPPPQLGPRNARIDDAALTAGRNTRDVRRLYNVSGRITDGTSTGVFDGPADQWVEELVDLATTEGMDTFVLWARGDVEQQLHRWAEQVVPAVRDEVARARRS